MAVDRHEGSTDQLLYFVQIGGEASGKTWRRPGWAGRLVLTALAVALGLAIVLLASRI